MRKIEVKNGMKCFGSQTVLDSVNIQCESGHIYGIVGHNGSGKTVLFKCICGFMNLDAGEIEIDGVKREKREKSLPERELLLKSLRF